MRNTKKLVKEIKEKFVLILCHEDVDVTIYLIPKEYLKDKNIEDIDCEELYEIGVEILTIGNFFVGNENYIVSGNLKIIEKE